MGGFDPGLEVAEDWDLWQRLARAGGRFVPAEGAGAIYRLRPASASHRSSRHLADHLEVLRRAHAPDPRVPAPSPENAAGRPADELPRNRAFLLLVVLGGRLGQGSDGREVVEAFEPGDLYLVEPDLIAERLDWGFQPGAACLPEDLPALWSAREPRITAALDALAARIGEPALGPALVLALARRFVHRLEAKALPLTIGPVHAVRLNGPRRLHGHGLPPGASVLRVYLGDGRRAVELPAEDGRSRRER